MKSLTEFVKSELENYKAATIPRVEVARHYMTLGFGYYGIEASAQSGFDPVVTTACMLTTGMTYAFGLKHSGLVDHNNELSD